MAADEAEIVRRSEEDEWDLGGEAALFKESYVCGHRFEDNEEWDVDDEVYALAKRNSLEMDPDEEETGGANQRPAKVQ